MDGQVRKTATLHPDPADLEVPAPIINRHVGRFELIRELGRGGMGQVFVGRDTKLGRKVAIKFLLREDPQFLQMFLTEARATARCTHESIVTIYEVGEHEGKPYMVLEYLEGKTLAAELDTKPSVPRFVELMIPVASALERAAEHGIVHCDLKPNNIFVTDRGQVKVLDFGIARIMQHAEHVMQRASAAHDAVVGDDEPTSARMLLGTLPYMSPEQFGADTVDHQSDIWPIGVMFWRAFGGAHPAGRVEHHALRDELCNLDRPLPSLGTRDSSLPTALVSIVDRCLAKRKADRYRNAGELAADLRAFLSPKLERAGDEVCPYRGLSAFGEDDAALFFGRANEIRTALAQLDTTPLLGVVGASGVGKSSFVHAGLIPALRASGGKKWRVCVLRPGRDPVERLAKIVEEVQGQHEVTGRLREAPGWFGTALRRAAAARSERILVVVDQLEELFTLCDDDERRRLFLTALAGAADDAASPIRVVLSIRGDFLDRLAGHEQFFAELSRGLFFLTAPDLANLREVLVRPAELAGYRFEASQIVDEMMQVATSRGALPLLSFAATRLWEGRDRTRKLLTLDAYQQMGGVAGAFARHADQVTAAVPVRSQLALRAIMTRLVTPEGTRAVVDLDELLSLAADRSDVERVIDHLVRARLVQTHTDPVQGTTVELVHEMLVHEWPAMRRWAEDSQSIRVFVDDVRQAAKQWAARGKLDDLVWRGATAREALAFVTKWRLELSAVEAEFLTAARRAIGRTQRRRWFAVGAVCIAIGAAFAGGTAALVRIDRAEANASARADDATRALAAAEAAKAELQKKLDIIADKERAKLAAEQEANAATAAEAQTKEELVAANRALRQQFAEADAARAKAQAAEAAAKQANEELQKVLAKERALRAAEEQQQKQIFNGLEDKK